MNHAELAALLDAAADGITAMVLSEMYRDPFWHARFGERADRHGKADGVQRLDQVVDVEPAAERLHAVVDLAKAQLASP